MTSDATTLRDESGTYLLWLQADREDKIEVGRLGVLSLAPGVYGYVGSAFGPGGVRARVQRHARTEDKALHWHIDYLRAATTLEAVWVTYDAARRECTWASVLRSLPEATVPLDGFGASDCDCPAHLVRFGSLPTGAIFLTRLRTATTNHAPVHRVPAPDPSR
jgi:Uri superfamily endonuclease